MSLLTSRLLAAATLAALVGLTVPATATRAGDAPTKVEVGKPAPNIELQATQLETILPDAKDKKTLSLKDLKGKNVVLFFYPKAMTPGCTKESCHYRDLTKDFAKLETVVLGISTDVLDAQEKFTAKEKLTFPLLADPDKKVTEAYGVLSPERGLAQRATFIIDKKGIVRKIYPMANADKNPQEALEWVRENLAEK
jgi:peroxiredoxin Q/BCP